VRKAWVRADEDAVQFGTQIQYRAQDSRAGDRRVEIIARCPPQSVSWRLFDSWRNGKFQRCDWRTRREDVPPDQRPSGSFLPGPNGGRTSSRHASLIPVRPFNTGPLVSLLADITFAADKAYSGCPASAL
jgi:hypothetical protein